MPWLSQDAIQWTDRLKACGTRPRVWLQTTCALIWRRGRQPLLRCSLRSCTAQGFPASFAISSEAAPDSCCAGGKPGFKHAMTFPEHTALSGRSWHVSSSEMASKMSSVSLKRKYGCTHCVCAHVHTFLARRTQQLVDGTNGSMGRAWSSLCFLCKI